MQQWAHSQGLAHMPCMLIGMQGWGEHQNTLMYGMIIRAVLGDINDQGWRQSGSCSMLAVRGWTLSMLHLIGFLSVFKDCSCSLLCDGTAPISLCEKLRGYGLDRKKKKIQKTHSQGWKNKLKSHKFVAVGLQEWEPHQILHAVFGVLRFAEFY